MIDFFKKIKLIRLDVIATIAWFLSDFFWLWDQIHIAVFFIPIVVTCMIVAIFRVKSKILKRIQLITLMWLIMNNIWMLSELSDNVTAVIGFKIIASMFGVIGMFQLAFYFLTKPKTITKFRRFLHYEA